MRKRFSFLGKSMLWSLLLYAVMMLAINWDEVRNTVNGNNAAVVENTYPSELQAPFVTTPSVSRPNISAQAGILSRVLSIAKTISGFTAKAASF